MSVAFLTGAFIIRQHLVKIGDQLSFFSQLLLQAENGIPCRHSALSLAISIIFHQSEHLFFLCLIQIDLLLAKYDSEVAVDGAVVFV